LHEHVLQEKCIKHLSKYSRYSLSVAITIKNQGQVNYLQRNGIPNVLTVGNVLQYRVFRLQYRIFKMEDYLLGGQVGDFLVRSILQVV
jgi:hypothetical protein